MSLGFKCKTNWTTLHDFSLILQKSISIKVNRKESDQERIIPELMQVPKLRYPFNPTFMITNLVRLNR